MGENKEIKVRLSTVVYIFIILILAIALGVVYYLGFVKNDNVNNMIASVKEIENEKKIKKINEVKDIVYTIEKRETIGYEGNVVTNKIPVINLNNDLIKKINEEIERNYNNMPDGLQLQDYQHYINDNILSVVIEKNSAYIEGATEFEVYNIDIYKGTLLDDKTLLYELKNLLLFLI